LDPATMPPQATISTMDQARPELGSQHGGGAWSLYLVMNKQTTAQG